MVLGWIAAVVTLALAVSQSTIQQATVLVSDEQSTIAALERPPVSLARVKHRTSAARSDARPLPRLYAIAPAHIALDRIDARIAEFSTTFVAPSPYRSEQSTRSRAPPLA